jgi:RsmE family RNA methyltransferase
VFHEKAVEEFPGTLPAVAAGGTLPEWRVLVGPEGGLAAGEVELLEKRGWHVRKMPTPVLRAETAVVVAGALVQYIARDYTSRFVR